MKNSKYFIVSILGFLMLTSFVFAQNEFQDVWYSTYNSNDLLAGDVLDVLESIAGFLMVIAGILAGIGLIWSGITYMTAGNNPTRVATAKAILKNTIIGAILLFAVGLILSTIANVVGDPLYFFQ